MSTSTSTSLLRRLHLRWLALPLPWRRRILAGTDLAQNTYWLLHPRAPRPRRIVLPPRARSPAHTLPAIYMGDRGGGRGGRGRGNRSSSTPAETEAAAGMSIPPQWMQWLRHARAAAPTVEELRADEARQQRMRGLVEAKRVQQEQQQQQQQQQQSLGPVNDAGSEQHTAGQRGRRILQGEALDQRGLLGSIQEQRTGGPESATFTVRQEDLFGPSHSSTQQPPEANEGQDLAAATKRTQEKGQGPWEQATAQPEEPIPWSPMTRKRR